MVIESNSWPQIQNSNPVSENIVQTPLELSSLGPCPLPCRACSVHTPLVKNLSLIPKNLSLIPNLSWCSSVPFPWHMRKQKVPVILYVAYGQHSSVRRAAAAVRTSVGWVIQPLQKAVTWTSWKKCGPVWQCCGGNNTSKCYALHYDSSAQEDLNWYFLWLQTSLSFCLTSHIKAFLLIYPK